MTNGWTDIRNADVIVAMGGNPAENHPVGFRFVMEARRHRNAKLVCVDPRFNRTAAVADRFVQIRVGTDIAFLGGLIHHVLSQNRYHEEYVKAFTNATFLVKDTYAFDAQQGVFSGWDPERKAYTDTTSWAYELDERGLARTDPAMQHARSVFQIMKAFYARYTPEAVANICGCTAADFLSAAELITSTGSADKAGTILYALGWTHHSHSVQLIHAAAMLQLLLGNIGRPGGGLNALRGHANIQGGTDCGVAYHNLPGYIAIPKADHETLDRFIAAVTPKPLREGATNFWSNTDRFMVSQLKAYYGDHATSDNEFGYSLHPRLPQAATGGYENWSWAYIFDHMYAGRMEGFLSFGMNPVSNGPHSRKAVAALSKLKWMVVAENFEQETATFWRDDILALVDKKPEDVQTEVFLLPAANFAEKGRLVRQLGAMDPMEVEGDRSTRRGQTRSGNHRENFPQGSRALRERGRTPSRARAAFELVVLQSLAAHRSTKWPRRSTAGRSADVQDPRTEPDHRPRRAATFPLRRHSRGWHARFPATGSTSGCTPMRAISRSAECPRIPAASGDIPSGPSAGRRTVASVQPLLRRHAGPAMGRYAHGHRVERHAMDW